MTNRYKFLILDLDGTLTNSQKEITPLVQQTLIHAQEKGIRLILASGRPAHGILPLAEALEMRKFHGYVLAFNGGKILDCHNNSILFEQSLPANVIPEIYRRSKDAGAAFLTYIDKKILTESPDNEYVRYAAFLNKMEIQTSNDFLNDLSQPINKCLAAGQPDMLVNLEKDMRKEFELRINIYRSEPFFLELVPLGIDKATAIEKLLKKIGIRREEVIAMGDGFNDLSMIRYAGLGVAMHNAQESVKIEADHVTHHTNDEDGVAHFLLEEIPEFMPLWG